MNKIKSKDYVSQELLYFIVGSLLALYQCLSLMGSMASNQYERYETFHTTLYMATTCLATIVVARAVKRFRYGVLAIATAAEILLGMGSQLIRHYPTDRSLSMATTGYGFIIFGLIAVEMKRSDRGAGT